ncbi:MAG: monofunctional biosynthetic peptidoglycan transglycosylase [Cellvibrionaceae bacterium]|nr:monofunctional biosynthetic peptidoglycan transglycosylase [Cellvibrionaceae bacterium]
MPRSISSNAGSLAKRTILGVFLLLFLYESWIFSQVLWWKWNAPKSTSFMSIRLEEMRRYNPAAKLRYEWVDYENISSHLKRAVVAAEDGKFVDHNGFDWDAIKNALQKNLQRGKVAAGGSTISQQLAKNLFLSPSKSYLRKIQEAVITGMIEITWDKRRILEVYLNVAEWGDGVFGAQAAARAHYGTSAAYLSAYQSARMAVMLPNPRVFEDRLPSYAIRYSQTVQRRMSSARIP